jgi:uncharacterized protein (TIGR00288 family)
VYKESLMKDLDEQKKIAVLIDADNAQHSRIKAVLAEISTHGHIITKRAYGDWSSSNLKSWKTILNEYSIQPVQQFAYTTGKNSTDASMIIDAMDLLYTGKYDSFVLVSSDSDFTKLASRLREAEKFVFGVGEAKTPAAFRNACDDFILVENLERETLSVDELIRRPRGVAARSALGKVAAPVAITSATTNSAITTNAASTAPNAAAPTAAAAAESPKPNARGKSSRTGKKSAASKQRQIVPGASAIEEVIELLDIASQKYADEDGWTNVAAAGTYIKRSMPDFDPRTYGFMKLSDLISSMTEIYDIKRLSGKGTGSIVAYKRV